MKIKPTGSRGDVLSRPLHLLMRIFILLCCTTVFSLTPKDLFSQGTKIKVERDQEVTVEEVFEMITRQTKYSFMYPSDMFKEYPRVSLKKGTVRMDKLINESLAYGDINIVLTANNGIIIQEQDQVVQFSVTGTITDMEGVPIPGATILIKGTRRGVSSDFEGNFSIQVNDEANVLVISSLGHEPQEIIVGQKRTFVVQLKEALNELDEVVLEYATGYQKVSPERATGSFVQIDNELLNRTVGTEVIGRLENVTPGLLFDKRQVGDTQGQDYRSLRIRGINSIESDNSPLVVVDNFPYEGDINSINPNDVESITVLKDAASASIWGAQAANGVIVITMKKGKRNQPLTVSFNNNITIGERPDLHYSPNFIPSKDFIGLERELFNRGYYDSDLSSTRYPAITPVVEFLAQHRDGAISDSELDSALDRMSGYDVRDEAEKYFYRSSFNQQTSLSLRGGSEKMDHYLSGGYDRNLENGDGNELNRITLVSNNTFRPAKGLSLSLGINMTQRKRQNNASRWGTVDTELPYNRFADESGNWLPVTNILRSTYVDQAEANGLLDWHYRPLQEKALRDAVTRTTDYRIDTGVQYDFLDHFSISVNYQYQQTISKERNLQDKDGFAVRHQVNRYTQDDGTRVFPYGGILSQEFYEDRAHSGRIQLSHHQSFNADHHVNTMVGMDVRETNGHGSATQLYGYDDNVLTYNNDLDFTTRYPLRPAGSLWLPPPNQEVTDLTDRYVSYYGNTSYSFKDRYVVSGSIRYDASNLFGVKTNQKGVPLWSVGASWDLSKETFYGSKAVPYLRLRATYGYNGNINKSVTAFPTARYSVDSRTDLVYLDLRSAGNPALKWEKIGMVNLGLDFALKNQRVSGTLEYFAKKGEDIIGEQSLDPSTGVYNQNLLNYVNYASTKTSGMDVQINTINMDKTFRWTSNILFSYTKNEITDFNDEAITSSNILAGITNNFSNLPQSGKPIDGVYSLPWYGLDPDTGNPLLEIDGEPSTAYGDYLRNIDMDGLKYHGVNVAPIFGSIRNNFTWKGLTLSANISWKAGYYFRKSSLNYYSLLNNYDLHRDYLSRWQATGDELITDVPSIPETSDSYRDYLYQGAELHVEKGDHIRWEDVNLSYTFDKHDHAWLPFRELRIYANAKNLGILWQASDSGLDPDYPRTTYLMPKMYSLGVHLTF
ncbi:SusC/RagA family TonB-linked outer membrane protein [Muricauda brasiliensis]|uniref:SusC/RagA family TonB-linked outer membrane protein n=1 Tax=Muricauda brasiliensis TaxID=2162892 RepID=UPI000D388A8F|nr:SusC/RagA family TonB-linked outer membrane protein [Muricauda brasiliensis]